MLRASLLAVAFLIPAVAAADDLPKPLTEDKRAEIAAKWRKAFDAQYEEAKKSHADALALAKLKPDDVLVQNRLTDAKSALASMKQAPLRYGNVFRAFGEESKAGSVVFLADPGVLVADVTPGGMIVEGSARRDGETVLVRYFLAGPTKSKKGAKITAPGLWHYAGDAEIGGKSLPVLYRFEVKKDEMPTFDKK